jgi:hypothetical protein
MSSVSSINEGACPEIGAAQEQGIVSLDCSGRRDWLGRLKNARADNDGSTDPPNPIRRMALSFPGAVEAGMAKAKPSVPLGMFNIS